MKKLLITALKIFFYLVLTAVVVGGLAWLVYKKGWPWWVGGAILIGIIASIVGVLFIRKLIFRSRERKFVKRVIEEDTARINAQQVAQRRATLDLQSRWQKALDVLRHSSLRKLGNPVYALPWYLVMGKTSSGKTTAIKNARLSSPLTDVTPFTEGGTQNCDWWFLDEAVIMDTAGRYASSLDAGPDKEEWREFLTLLAKSRKREPISGLIITIGVDRLLSEDTDEVLSEARSIRRRIDELMRALSARFPVYLLVTKMDLIPGMQSFYQFIPEPELKQAMGWMNVSLLPDTEDTIDAAVDSVAERLKDLRLALLNNSTEVDPELVLFPDIVERLRPNLQRFGQALLDRNMFQETPTLRGVYFCSGSQSNDRMDLPEELLHTFSEKTTLKFPTLHAQPPKQADKGFFLFDFFSQILPGDRRLYSPLMEFVRWERIMQGLGMFAVFGIIISLCGLFTFSYIKNVQTLNEFIEDFPTVPTLKDNLRQNLVLMDDYREELYRMKALNAGWVLPRMGFNQSLDTEKKLETLYCNIFRKGVLQHFDDSLNGYVGSLDATSSEKELTQYIQHFVGRINILDDFIKAKDPSTLTKVRMPVGNVFGIVDQNVANPMAHYFDKEYLAYLRLNKHKDYLVNERDLLTSMLQRVLSAKRTELYWLVDWANGLQGVSPVTMEQFWGLTSHPVDDTIQVAPAFTMAGRTKILKFISQIESAMDEPGAMDNQISKFKDWYATEYVAAWEEFARDFPKGAKWQRTQQEWRAMARDMADLSNPYFDLMTRMDVELQPYTGKKQTPPWLAAVNLFQRVREKAAQQATVDKAQQSLLKDIKAGKQVLDDITSPNAQKQDAAKEAQTPQEKLKAAKDKLAGGLNQDDSVFKAADQFKEYEKDLGDMLPATVSEASAFTMASNFFSAAKNPKESKSPFQTGHVASLKIFELLEVAKTNDDIFFPLLTGPMDFLLDFTMREAATNLQELWDGTVLSSITAAPVSKQSSILFDEKTGKVWKFVNGPAEPFLGRGVGGYYSKEYVGKFIPFEDDFFLFLEQGAVQTQSLLPKYQVDIKAQPTDTNNGVQEEPFATQLTMDCAAGTQQLENYNYPAKSTFTWKPNECGDVHFKIKFNDFTLTRRYADGMGFPKFLDDFRYGSRTFTPKDFPGNAQTLESLGITDIVVNYEFEGNMPVINLLHTQTLDIPKIITHPFIY